MSDLDLAPSAAPPHPAPAANGDGALQPGTAAPELPAAAALFIRDLLDLEVRRMKAAGIPVGTDEYRGLYVSSEEAARILARPPGPADRGPARLPVEAIAGLLACDGGRLARLAAMAGLTPPEAGAVLLALASECDLDLERLVAYVQDDVTKKRPRVELAVRLFGSPSAPSAAAAMFDAAAPLRRFEIVRLGDEPGQPDTPLLSQQLILDPRIAAYLAGSDAVDERLLPHLVALPAPRPDGRVGLGPEFEAEIDAIAAMGAATLDVPVVAIAGPDESTRLRSAIRLAEGSGLGCIAVRFGRLAAQLGLETALTLALREGALKRCAVVLENLDLPDALDRQELRRRLRAAPIAPLVVLSSSEPLNWPGLSIDGPALAFDELIRHWEEHLPADAADRSALRVLAGKFRLNADQVADAAEAARGLALRRNPAAAHVEVDDLYAAARSQSTPILNDLARKVPPHFSWDDLILPAEIKEQLREICAHMEYRAVVLDEWGLARRLSLGRGLTALFAGNSGTGKTMAAGVMSGALGLDLYKIDLSGVVSKYIGETEKNLAGIFREAETSNAILFFDEADALFGKRSDVKDAHDRYANIETAYLLQKMEEYAGIVILATNLKMNLDEAFLRRLSFVVDFPMPEEDDRLRIWKTTIPAEMPLAPDVDLEFLARQFRLAGGNIRNIVLAAAFLAASEGTGVAMSHFIRATRREYQKLGRMVTASDFGEHIGILRGADVRD
jgi:hypothetical protein